MTFGLNLNVPFWMKTSGHDRYAYTRTLLNTQFEIGGG